MFVFRFEPSFHSVCPQSTQYRWKPNQKVQLYGCQESQRYVSLSTDLVSMKVTIYITIYYLQKLNHFETMRKRLILKRLFLSIYRKAHQSDVLKLQTWLASSTAFHGPCTTELQHSVQISSSSEESSTGLASDLVAWYEVEE